MRSIVTGADGMLGNAVLRELLRRGEPAEGWSRSVAHTTDGIEFFQLDLIDVESAERIWRRTKPELIVHCAALTDADFCEENRHVTQTVNAFVPGCLARVAKELGARFVYVSTDAVYDGEKIGRRREDEPPNPLSVYATTKLEGEGRVLAAYPEALVIRTNMFGWTLPTAPRSKFAEEILAALTARRPIQLWSDAIFSPLHVGLLAEVILCLAELRDVFDRDRTLSGVLNVGARDPISKADFGRMLATVFGLDGSLIEDTSVGDVTFQAVRTKNVGLNVSRFRIFYGREIPSVLDGITRLYEEALDGTAETIRGRAGYP